MAIKTTGLAILAMFVLAADSAVFAQTPGPARPDVGLFGRKAEPKTVQTLDISASVLESYDDDVYADGGTINPVVPPTSGFFTNFDASANYGWQGRHTQFGATGGSAVRYYHDLGDVQLMNYTAGVGLSSQFTDRTSVFVNQSTSYSPSYLYRLFPDLAQPVPGSVAPPAPDYSVNAQDTESYSYNTNASLTHKLSSRSVLSATAEYGFVNFVKESVGRKDSKTYAVRGEFGRNTSRNTIAKIGYRYRNGDVGLGVTAPTVEHGIDVGMEYVRPLSAIRKATFGFALGTSAVSIPSSTLAVASGQVYRATGSATFGYQFSRAWQTKASYRRGLDYVPELAQPVFTDGVTGMLEGLFNDRLDFAASVSYSSGEPAYFTQTAAFDTYTGDVRLRYAMTRLAALQAEYLYYFYDFKGALTLPAGAPPTLERNGVRVGVTLWVPALRR